ncbi:hybrid sensor histidine kinase/response regulator [Gemmatimonas sp.]
MTQRNALSIRATIIGVAAVAFGSVLIAGLAMMVRVVPNAERLTRRGNAARDDYTARSVVAAQLDSSMSDLWRLARRAKLAPIPPESIAVRRLRLEDIVRRASKSTPRRPELSTSTAFGIGLDQADVATTRVAASLLGAVSAMEIGDLAAADRLMSRADSLDAPLKARLYQVTQIALSDLATEEERLERDTRFATRLLLGWLLACALAGPLLWRQLQRRLMQPLATFGTVLDRVEAGDLDVEVPVEYDDEFGRLGAHFNRTTHVLRAQRKEAERVAAQGALEASEARYRDAFEQAAVGLAEVDLTGRILRVNRAICAMLSREMSEVVGRRFVDYAHPDDLAAIAENWPRIAGGDPQAGRVERRFMRADGNVAITQVTATMVYQPDGTPRHVLAVVHDITEQRRLAQELAQSSKLEAVGQLAGGVAHDFNNLLAGIIGYAELVEENPDNATEVREDAASIKRAALKGADLARSLLTLARRNTKRQEPFALAPMLTEIVDLARRTFDRRVEITLRACADATVRGDRSLLSNAMLNLAVNARDAMPAGGTLHIDCQLLSVDAAFRERHALPAQVPIVAITVSDTGAGMGPGVLEHVFEPFFTTKPPDKGTGLGLAMVYGTVKDHLGAVTIDSTVGRGTTVTVYLPSDPSAPVSNEDARNITPARAPSRVLVVDDEAMIRTVAKRLLERLGYEVEVAEDGLAALERLERDGPPIHLVIIDGNMPRLDGIETARRIHERYPALPMLFATGHFDPAGREDLAALGFRDRIDKPFSLDAFAATVARCLE